MLSFNSSEGVIWQDSSANKKVMYVYICMGRCCRIRLREADHYRKIGCVVDNDNLLAILRLQFAVCSLQFAVCSLQFAVCSLQFAVCSLQFAVCSLRFCIIFAEIQSFSRFYNFTNSTIHLLGYLLG